MAPGGRPPVRAALGHTVISASRPLLEGTVRDRLLRQCPRVTLSEGVSVERPLVEGGGVRGVATSDGEWRADLVVDCTGRGTKSLEALARLGYPAPETSAITIDMAYRTRVVRRRPGDMDGGAAVSIGDPVRGHRMGVMVPVEDDRWIITLGSFHGDAAPTDPAGFEAFARSLPSPQIADVLSRSEALSTTGCTSVCRESTMWPWTWPGGS